MLRINKFTPTDELRKYIAEHYRRAVDARSEQVEVHYPRWEDQYRGIPAEKVRDIPWHNSSNLVVPVSRMFIDTFVARTLNVVFATKPLIQVYGAPKELAEGVEAYLNLKAIQDWGFYELSRGALYRGNKHGTAMVKTPWVTKMVNQFTEQGPREVITYDGPAPSHVAFDDWFVYPITAEKMDDVLIKFHVMRYPEEAARRKVRDMKWAITPDQLDAALQMPQDAKRIQEESRAGVDDYDYRELKAVECYLEWKVQGDYYRVVVVYEPENETILEAYFDPFPAQCKTFHAYRPFPRDDMFPGESACQILGVLQEEISTIHNDRRNLSTLAAAPQFIVKDGARVPNASTNFYPGKTWVVDEMDDMKIEHIRASYQEMLGEEQQAFMLGEKVFGVGGLMMGHSQGQMGKGGVYNAAGTIAVMSESNQRQNTNIRDFRLFLGEVAKDCFILQKNLNPMDPTLEQLPQGLRQQAQQALSLPDDQWARVIFDVRMSDSAANREIEKANVLTMANVVSQFISQSQGLVNMMYSQNPVLQQLGVGAAQMGYSSMRTLLKEFDMNDLVEDLPNVSETFRAVQQQQHSQGGGMGQAGGPPQQPGMGPVG